MKFSKLMSSPRYSLSALAASLLLIGCDPIEGPGNPVTGTGDGSTVSTSSKGGGSGGSRKTCSDFDTQAAAQADFAAGNTGLDGDNDGVACEGLLK